MIIRARGMLIESQTEKLGAIMPMKNFDRIASRQVRYRVEATKHFL